MPMGRKVGGVVLWDAERIRTAWLTLIDADELSNEDGDNPFDLRVV